MDESLSEFQEPKKSCTGPKNTAKPKPKTKPKKAPKRIRGQKDIRTAIKGKKELESYSKDFEKVCKKAGINVDSEDLQLAIALSKSLQNEPSTSQSGAVTSQERIGKIRTTLQEYGFKVPEIKITTATRKQKRYRKNYKLIQTSDIEKKELIARRYSDVLFKNIISLCNLDNIESNSPDNQNIKLYTLATIADYNILKNQDTFYVNNLIEKSTTSGNLLRDWSEIPGRAVSPKLVEPSNMNFSEIECSQDEIDVVLSGTLKSCKVIMDGKKNHERFIDNHEDNDVNNLNEDEIYNNEKTLVINSDNIEVPSNKQRSCSPDIFDDDASSLLDESDLTIQDKTLKTKNIELDKVISKTCDNLQTTSKAKKNNSIEYTDITNCNEIDLNCDKICPSLSQKCDITKRKSNDCMEITDCIEIEPSKAQLPISQISNVTKRKTNDFMEITDCIEIDPKHDIELPMSQKNNITKRKSNDFMEITACVGSSSQPLLYDKIDLTQIPEEITESSQTEKFTNLVERNKDISPKTIDNIDLTHYPYSYNRIVFNKELKNSDKEVNEDNNVDLTQSSNSDDELPFICLSGNNNKNKEDNSSEDTIDLDLNEYPELNKSLNSETKTEVHVDLTQHEQSTIDISKPSQSFFEEYIHNHSDNNEEGNNSNEKYKSTETFGQYLKDNTENRENLPSTSIKQSKENNISNEKYIVEDKLDVNKSNNDDESNANCKNVITDRVNLTLSPIHKPTNSDIDLTQNSDDSLSPCSSQINSIIIDNFKESIESNVTSKNSQSCSSLGKKGDVSIDYDELSNAKLDDNFKSISCTNLDENFSAKSLIYDIADEKESSQDCSQNLEFQISDKELDYSMHKSKLETPDNFALGGISIIDHLSELGSFKKSIDPNVNKNVENVKQKEISPIKHKRITEIATPQKVCSTITVFTPNNSEFIIKTNNVTPMLDYKTMSTPEIHKELDKYGIKPFKRKRAIQLLRHIYNQTHPTIESCDEYSSPPKRHKPNKSPRKRISPRKLLQSPKKVSTEENAAKIDNSIQKEKCFNADRCMDIQSTSKVVIVKVPTSAEIECKPEDWVFQKREKAKVPSCRVPLHIAFYNYIQSNRELREAILCYEPVYIDDIHKDLVGYGHRYDPKDLLKFMDKKCITVKTTDNDARNNKR